MITHEDFYRRWVVANAVAEGLGLGTTLVLGWLAGEQLLANQTGVIGTVATAATAVALGTFLEGVVLGACQSHVLARAWSEFPKRRWIVATAVGAALAWMLGMIPSTVASIVTSPSIASGHGGGQSAASARAAAAIATEPGLLVTLALAALMGLVLGPFLGVPQGLVLRAVGGRPGRWALANSLAWMVGMPVVFLGTALVDETSSALRIVAVMGLCTVGAGAVVGAVHGRFLLHLLPLRAATSIGPRGPLP